MLKEIVYKSRDNVIELQLKQDGYPVQLDNVLTRAILNFEHVDIVDIDSDVIGEGVGQPFDWTAGDGILKLKLGEYIGNVDIPAGVYNVRLILFDAINTLGIVWGDQYWQIEIEGDTTTGYNFPDATRTITENYTAVPSDEVILVDATADNIDVELFTAVNYENKEITIKKIDISANTVSITSINGQTIDGETSVVLLDQYESLTIRSDNSNWYII